MRNDGYLLATKPSFASHAYLHNIISYVHTLTPCFFIDQAETISNEIGNCSNQAFITTYFDVLLRKVKEKRHSVFDLQKIYG